MRPFQSWSLNRTGNSATVFITKVWHEPRPADAEYRAGIDRYYARNPGLERTVQPWGCCKAMRNTGHDATCVNSPYCRRPRHG